MLINLFLRHQRQRVNQLAEQGRQQHKLLQAEQWLLRQRAEAFISSTPGLLLSFMAGCVFQLRHNTTVKAVRRTVGLRWLKLWL